MKEYHTKLKKDDTVIVITGKYKGANGKIQLIDIKKNQAIVSGINMVKKAIKRKSQNEQGGIISIEAPINLSNLQILSKGSPSRLGYKIENDKKVRFAKKSGEIL